MTFWKGSLRISSQCVSKRFADQGHDLSFDLLDFWQWSASDLVGNTLRGVLAEYIVAQALAAAREIREGWAPYDLITQVESPLR